VREDYQKKQENLISSIEHLLKQLQSQKSKEEESTRERNILRKEVFQLETMVNERFSHGNQDYESLQK